jgi:hypothetical protein
MNRPDTDLEMRVATRSDVAALLSLVMEYHEFEGIKQSVDLARTTIEPLLEVSDQGRIWLIESEGKLVGYVAVCFGYSIELGGRDAFIDDDVRPGAVQGEGNRLGAATS